MTQCSIGGILRETQTTEDRMEIKLIRFSRQDQTIHFIADDSDPLATPEYSVKGDVFQALESANHLNVPYEIED